MTNSQKVVSGYLLLASLEACAGIVSQLAVPSDPENQFILGYSLSRLILIAAFFLTFAWLAMLAWRAWRDPNRAERIWNHAFSSPQRITRLLWVFGAALALLITVLLIPLYRFGGLEVYVARLRPGLWWGALVSAQTLIVLGFVGRQPLQKIPALATWRKPVLTIGVVLLVLVLTGGWAIRSLGEVPPGLLQWAPAGVPLLSGQVWLIGWLTIAITAGGAFLRRAWISRQKERGRKWNPDLLIGLGIWALTAALWASVRLPPNFFFPGPYPPGDVVYPYADAASWDTGAHFAFIGQGFGNNNPFQDHAGWMGVLAFLHLLFGQDYARMSAFLAALLAIFPALMYWLGKAIHSRFAGLFIAGLAIVHEMNAFAASSMIDLSHARFLLTEYPVRVGAAALALWLFYWLRAPRQGMAYALPIGGVLAAMILARFNTLAMPLAVIFGVLLVFGRDWKAGLRASLLILFSLNLVLAPWMWRSWTISGTPLFYLENSQKIFNENFRILPPSTPTPTDSSSLKEQIPSERGRFSLDAQLVRNNLFASSPQSVPPTGGHAEKSTSAIKVILSHFAHNLVTSALILPTDLAFQDLRTTIYDAHPFWEKIGSPWRGELTFPEATLLVIHLFLISIGIWISWRKWKLIGLAPLGVCLAYTLSLSVARTSGGRYIVPMDWGVLFYWGLGITQSVIWGAAWFGAGIQESRSFSEPETFSYKRGWLYLLPFLLFVGAMTVMDRTVPQRYTEMSRLEVFKLLNQTGALEQADIPAKEFAAFLGQKGSQAFIGRGLYPRFYVIGEGERSSKVDAYDPAKYPRLSFTLIGAFGEKGVVLPFIKPPSLSRHASYFSNASDVIVLGCFRPGYRYIIDAVLIVVLGENPTLYVRQPEAPLQCPLPEPVCESYQNCH